MTRAKSAWWCHFALARADTNYPIFFRLPSCKHTTGKWLAHFACIIHTFSHSMQMSSCLARNEQFMQNKIPRPNFGYTNPLLFHTASDCKQQNAGPGNKAPYKDKARVNTALLQCHIHTPQLSPFFPEQFSTEQKMLLLTKNCLQNKTSIFTHLFVLTRWEVVQPSVNQS